MDWLLGPLLIFALRIGDVSVGTMRVLYMVRGRRVFASVLAAVEAGIYIVAIARVFQNSNMPLMIGYALGYAAGTAVGITLEQWIASGFIAARIISRGKSADLLKTLRDADYGVTAAQAEGREGSRMLLFVVAPRKRAHQLLRVVEAVDPEAFVTIDPANPARGGYLARVAPAALRK